MEMTDRVKGAIVAALMARREVLEGELAEVVAAMVALSPEAFRAEPEAATVQPSARSIAQRRRWAKRKGGK